MKNKFQFLLPRLLVITAVAGLVTIVIGAIFKILLLATALFTIGTLVYTRIQKRRMRAASMPQGAIQPGLYAHSNPQHAVTPLENSLPANTPKIVPIY
ncbi:hypothetical protein FXV77_06890 [Sphingobacterium phlebotomi]|uniref:Uncharacterized protein n=1 Tax=Sphingobacterium phlebotomi TaxID=2605433 RepID=A0A5D4HAQ2_9SPHI|nr:hypothetical protein [Sphingobacterium phlebotomi]TYR36899.1 hypothetical protein FXV77_06890 [Sphingobacterium phlebotomi]